MIEILYRRLWMAWCAFWIVIVLLVLIPLLAIAMNIGPASWQKAGHRMVQIAAKAVLFLWGIRVVEHGKNLVDHKRQQVYVANHRSDLDPIATLSAINGYWKFLGKAELLRWPLIGYLVGKLYVTVDRGDLKSRDRSVQVMEEKIRDGASIVIYPEGWSNFSEAYLLELKQGAFRLALKAKLPITVFTICGANILWPKPYLRLRPGVVHIYWESVIETTAMNAGSETDFEALRSTAERLWISRLKECYPQGMHNPKGWPDFEQWKAGILKK